MSTWDRIAEDNLKAAQTLADSEHFRSCVNRAYYAAFSAVSFALKANVPFAKGRETPPHQDVPHLLKKHLTGLVPKQIRDLQARIRRLYNERLTADYISGRTVGVRSALQARQDAYVVCKELGVVDASRR